jgi:hypothetical protein
MIEPSAGWICVTRTPAGIADSETSLTAEVDMGSDLPLRPCCSNRGAILQVFGMVSKFGALA